MMKYPEDLVSVPLEEKIPRSAMYEIQRRLPEDALKIFEDLDTTEGEWSQYKVSNRLWHTRFRSMLYKKARIKLDPAVLSPIGEIIERHYGGTYTAHMFFAKAMVPLEFDAGIRGIYAYSGIKGWTCWREPYNDNTELAERYFKSGGRCVRFYASQKAWLDDPWHGTGRMFIIEQDGYLFASNPQGSNREKNLRALCRLFDMENKSCNLVPPMGYFDDTWVLGKDISSAPTKHYLKLR